VINSQTDYGFRVFNKQGRIAADMHETGDAVRMAGFLGPGCVVKWGLRHDIPGEDYHSWVVWREGKEYVRAADDPEIAEHMMNNALAEGMARNLT